MNRAILCFTLAGLLGITAIPAAPASIPIYQPTVITEPGHYIVTRDIEVDSGYAIEIQSDDVTLDLNDHRIISTSDSDAVINFGWRTRVVFRNGQVKGGSFGIEGWGAGYGTVRIERILFVDSYGSAVYLESVRHFEIVSCVFDRPTGHGIQLNCVNGPCSGHIVDNAIIGAGSGIYLIYANDTIIQRNVITEAEGMCIQDIYPNGGNTIEGNSCSISPWAGLAASRGIAIDMAHKDRIVGNTVKGFSNYGIWVRGDGNLIADNVVGDAVIVGAGTGHGINVYQGERNLILGNQVEGNPGCGIRFDTAAADNAYRENMLRGNSGGTVCNLGTGNTDEGGNIP